MHHFSISLPPFLFGNSTNIGSAFSSDTITSIFVEHLTLLMNISLLNTSSFLTSSPVELTLPSKPYNPVNPKKVSKFHPKKPKNFTCTTNSGSDYFTRKFNRSEKQAKVVIFSQILLFQNKSRKR